MQIYLTTPSLPKEGFEALRAHRFTDRLEEAEIIISTFDYQVSAEMIQQAKRLKLIANFGVGYNNIDLEACKALGIHVTNTPLPVIEPTAELCFALMMTIARKTALFDRQLRQGTAEPFGVMNNLSNTLYGKILGIIGMGNIGQAVARRAVASGMTIVYHNRHRLPEEIEAKYNARYVTKEELLQTADFVSLNLPYTPDVHHLIGRKELEMMKKTAYLINTARGAHIHEEALIEALQNQSIAGAALDVYEFEPRIGAQLLELDNIVLSPHTGTGTWDGRLEMCKNVAENILYYVEGQLDKMNIVL